MNWNITVELGSVEHFRQAFACNVVTIPGNVALVGWLPDRQTWLCAPHGLADDPVCSARIPGTLNFLTHYVLPHLPVRPFWTFLCVDDGWRERNVFSPDYRWVDPPDLSQQREWKGAPGEIPILSPDRRWVGCFGAHRGDPSALLLPEAHYVSRNFYEALFAATQQQSVRWEEKTGQAIYCGGNHGECTNYFPPIPAGRPHPRLQLIKLAQSAGLPIHVHLGNGVPQGRQMGFKYILDLDGYVRTWDAWAWKMHSGSTVLSVESPWESFFTRSFEPWTHFVPVANDFSDLAEKLAWCMAHDADCRTIAEQAKRRAQEVYRPEQVAQTVLAQLRARD